MFVRSPHTALLAFVAALFSRNLQPGDISEACKCVDRDRCDAIITQVSAQHVVVVMAG
jgi:hypothetical protein